MNRIFIGLSVALGSLLTAGCGGTEETPVPETRAEDPVFTGPRGDVTTHIAGFAWDPEAFHINLMSCAAPDSGCPADKNLQSDLNPIFNYSKIQGAVVLAFDPAAGAPAGFGEAPTGVDGQWSVASVPSRPAPPYFMASVGAGALVSPPAGAVVAPIATAAYLPTFTARPITARHSACYYQESAQVSPIGVLEAVAKYRTSKGQSTAVADFLNPAKFAAVVVIWQYEPRDLPNVLQPAAGTTVETGNGPTQQYHIAWAKPGKGPSGLQSVRGFYVADGAATSPAGITVVLVPAGFPAPVVHYQLVDTVTDPTIGRPGFFPPLDVPPVPGQITSLSAQLFYGGPTDGPPALPPLFVCVN